MAQPTRGGHPLSEPSGTSTTLCMWAVKKQTKKLKSTDYVNANKGRVEFLPHTHLVKHGRPSGHQQSPTATLPATALTLSRLSYPKNSNKLEKIVPV